MKEQQMPLEIDWFMKQTPTPCEGTPASYFEINEEKAKYVNNLIEKIRNEGMRTETATAKNIFKDDKKWNILCAAMDVLEDTQIAISSYPRYANAKVANTPYLLIYGILNTLSLQQNAIMDVCNVFNVSPNLPPLLTKIRDIRNGVASHPTANKKKEDKRNQKSFHITRGSVSMFGGFGFEMITYYEKGIVITKESSVRISNQKTETVKIKELIDQQHECIKDILIRIINTYEKEERRHRMRYKDKKLISIFHNMDYLLSKIYRFDTGLTHTKMLSEMMDEFKNQLAERDEGESWIEHDYKTIKYGLDKLHLYYGGDEGIHPEDVSITASFLQREIGEAKEMARQLDEKYRD